MTKTKFEILVSRVYKFQKVEIKAISDEPLSFEDANSFRQEVAKLADIAREELKHKVEQEEEIENLKRRLAELKNHVAKYPKTEDGKFNASEMNQEQKKLAREYRDLTSKLEKLWNT